MMRNNILYYTKLDTFKCNEFEIPRKILFDELEDLIIKDRNNTFVKCEGVYGKYSIRYKGKLYKVYYGNNELRKDNCNDQEFLDGINKLCRITDLFDRNKVNNKERKEIIEKAEHAIFHDDLDKKVYLDYLEEKFKKENSHILKKTIKELGEDFFEKDDDSLKLLYRAGLILLVGIFALYLGLENHVSFITTMGLISLGVGGADMLLCTLDVGGFKGIFSSFLNILSFPLRLFKNLGKKKEAKKHYNWEIDYTKKHFYNPSEYKDPNDYGGQYEYTRRQKATKVGEYLLSYIESTKDKILEIKDNDKRKELSKEMLALSSMFTKDTIKVFQIFNTDDYNDKYSIWLDGINARIDSVLERTDETIDTSNRIEEMIETIEPERVMVKSK